MGMVFQIHFAVSNVFLGSEVFLYEVLVLCLIAAVCNWWISDFSRKEKSFLISNRKKDIQHCVYKY